MKCNLTIAEKLKDLRIEKGLSLEELEARIGLSKSTLGNYETNDYKDISHTSIIKLAQFYNVSTDYLLGLTENKEPVNAEIASLGFDDEVIRILQSGRINSRLLGEVIKDNNFINLMTDLEIYVDNLASLQIRNLNSYVSSIRETIKEKNDISDDDHYLTTLSASVIDEDKYFSNILSDDIVDIATTIREAHKNDLETGEDSNPLRETLELIEEFKNAPDATQAQLAVFGNMLKINFSKMDPYEFKTFTDILFKYSKLYRKGGTGRGKKK